MAILLTTTMMMMMILYHETIRMLHLPAKVQLSKLEHAKETMIEM